MGSREAQRIVQDLSELLWMVKQLNIEDLRKKFGKKMDVVEK